MRRLVSTASLLATPVATQVRTQIGGRVPNKGYREQPPVPDRLKDAFSQYGSDPNRVDEGKDPAYVPEEQRQRVLQDVMSSTQNLKNYYKMDRLRAALDRVHNETHEHEGWLEVYMFLRTTELCTELERVPSDTFPKGHKLWIELQYCEEQRVPPLLEMANGMLVLPVFSMEEYLDHYFSLVRVFESCWFPIPRTGSERWDEYCNLDFPVGCTGGLQHCSTFATVSHPGNQFAILLNAGQRSSKFITYPEMVELAKIKQAASKDRNLDLKDRNPDGTSSDRFVFDPNLMRCFDTRKMPMKRVLASEVAAKMRARPGIPPVAQMELQLLLYRYPEIGQVFVRTVERPRWRTMMGGPERVTHIDVVPVPGAKPPKEFFPHLQRWSFMKEFKMDVHVELTETVPVPVPGSPLPPPLCIYSAADGKFLRDMDTYHGSTVADSLGYNEPIVDSGGRKAYEPYGNYA